ncbi:MAG TPA: zf-HC2 domain-containing protein [Candidatus Latescibacteria bacterium]|nr:zf-HC2 domain-containing protein [Candidatus Latescibacterota bacterium]
MSAPGRGENICLNMRDLLSAYLDGETTPEETARVDAHLNTCEACRVVLARYRTIERAIAGEVPGADPAPQDSAVFTDAVMSRIREVADRPTLKAHILKWRTPVVSALAIAATVVLALYLRPRTPEEPIHPVPTTTVPSPQERRETAQIASKPSERRPLTSGGAPTPRTRAQIAEPPVVASAELGQAMGDIAPDETSIQDAKAKPARGGVSFVQDFYATRAAQAITGAAPAKSDSVVPDLRRKADAMRTELVSANETNSVDSLKLLLGDVLARIAERTGEPLDVRAALTFWRQEYAVLAKQSSDSVVQSRVSRLEGILRSAQPKGSFE